MSIMGRASNNNLPTPRNPYRRPFELDGSSAIGSLSRVDQVIPSSEFAKINKGTHTHNKPIRPRITSLSTKCNYTITGLALDKRIRVLFGLPDLPRVQTPQTTRQSSLVIWLVSLEQTPRNNGLSFEVARPTSLPASSQQPLTLGQAFPHFSPLIKEL